MNFIKSIAPISLLTLALIATACSSSPKTEDEHAHEEVLAENIVELRDDQVKLANIQFGKIETKEMSGSLKVNGVVAVAPQNLATVCMPLGGFIKSTSLIPGRSVRKGETLAIIENQEFVNIQQSYLEAKTKLEFAEAEYKRHTDLYKNDVYSQKNLQQVTSDFKVLKAQVKGLEQKLLIMGIHPSRINENNISSTVAITAPLSGIVKSVNINIGKYVGSSDVLFEIVNSDQLYLELTLFEKDADKISKGQKIRFLLNNESEQHTAIVLQTGNLIGNDKTYKVFATVSGSCKNILPGMYVNAFIETNSQQTTAVPSEAVVSFDDKDYIFVFEKNKTEDGKPFTEYKMIPITKGVSDKGFTEVVLPKKLVPEQLKVVVKGAYNLLSAKKNAGEMSC